MTELDAELGPIGFELIEEFGKAIEFTSVGSSQYDVLTGLASASVTIGQLKAIVEDSKGLYASGVLVQSAEKKITISQIAFSQEFGQDFQPKPSDKFEIDNETFTIGEKGVKAVYTGNLIAIYEIYGAK